MSHAQHIQSMTARLDEYAKERQIMKDEIEHTKCNARESKTKLTEELEAARKVIQVERGESCSDPLFKQ